jgi:hypothetical protein
MGSRQPGFGDKGCARSGIVLAGPKGPALEPSVGYTKATCERWAQGIG